MRRLFRACLLCAVLTAATAAAALALEGQVVDQRTGSPIAGAEVTILGRPGAARTDADGRFVWQPSPVPPFEVLVVLPGERYTQPVFVDRLPAAGPLVIAVAPLLQEAVSVAAGAAPDIESMPASATTLLTATDLQVRQPATLAHALENVAGVALVSEGQAAVPAVRGLARGRTLILIDGARVTAERRVGPSATFLDPFVLDAIEVARGPGSVAYGSDAFGGVIYARSRRAEVNEPWSGRFAGTAGAGIPEWRVGAELARGGPAAGFLVLAHARTFDDYRSPGGRVTNSGARDRGVLLRGAVRLGPGLLRGGYQGDAGRDVGRPRTNSAAVRFYYPREDSHRLIASYDADAVAGFDRVGVTGFVGSHRVVTDQDRAATAAAARRVERADVDARDFQVRAQGERVAGRARVKAGVDVHGRFDLHATDALLEDAAGTLAPIATSVSIDRARRTDAGIFATFDTALAGRVAATGGVRVDRVTARNRGGFFGDRTSLRGAVSGMGAVSAGPFAGVTVTGQVTRGFRDPTLSDRYYRGPTGRGFITGEPSLDPETSRQLDLAVRYVARRLRLGLFAYRYRIDDLVERFEEGPDVFFFRNRGRAHLDGVEVEAQLTPRPGFTLEVAASAARGRAEAGGGLAGAPLDDVAPRTLTLVVRRSLGSRAFVQGRGLLVDRDRRPGPTEVATPGHGLIDAAAGWRLTRHVDLRVSARNLLDHTYPLSPDARATAAPGRSISATTIVKF